MHDFTFRSFTRDGKTIYQPCYRFDGGAWQVPTYGDDEPIECTGSYEAEACAARVLLRQIHGQTPASVPLSRIDIDGALMSYRGYTLKSSEHGHHAVKDGTIYSLELFASQEALRRDIDAFLDSDTYSDYLAGKRAK